MGKPFIIAHRGASGLSPENTIVAFEKAIELGADGIELDVHLTFDGVVVVHHDYRVSAEWARNGDDWIKDPGPEIPNITLEEVKSFDVGRLAPKSKYKKRYPDYTPVDGTKIATLREVLDLVRLKAPDTFQLWIELKVNSASEVGRSMSAALVEKTILELQASRLLQKATIISFYWPALIHALQFDRDIKAGFISATGPSRNNTEMKDLGEPRWGVPFNSPDLNGSIIPMIKTAGGQIWSVYWRDLTADRLLEAQQEGIKVGVWTIRNRFEADQVLKLGVDFITTDRPDWFKR